MADRDPTFDPRSPVQSDRSPAPLLLGAVFAALALWTAWQNWPDDQPSGRARQETQPVAGEKASPPRSEQARRKNPLVGLITSDDYPAEALDRDEQGTTAFRLDIGSDGQVNHCTVTESSGSRVLDTQTCRIITARARFSPGHDGDGKPVPSTYQSRVTWRLED